MTITTGSGLVAQHFAGEKIIAPLRNASLALRLGTVHRLETGDSLTVPLESSMTSSAVYGEGDTITPSDPVWSPLVFEPQKIATRTLVSSEFARDAWLEPLRGSHVASIANTLDELAFGALALSVSNIVTASGPTATLAEAKTALGRLSAHDMPFATFLVSPVTYAALSDQFQVNSDVAYLLGHRVVPCEHLGTARLIVGDLEKALHTVIIGSPFSRYVDEPGAESDLAAVVTSLRASVGVVGSILAGVDGA